MAEIVSLNTQKKAAAEPQKDIIEMLESLLKDAQRGLIQGFAFAAIHHGGDLEDCYAGSCSVFEMLGVARILCRTLEDKFIRDNE